MTGGVAVIDYDNDGWPDIYFVNGAKLPEMNKTGPQFWNRLYRNNHDGTFADVTEQLASEVKAIQWVRRWPITTTMAIRICL
jgi:hypothetical protein